jgi:hypothetical protein
MPPMEVTAEKLRELFCVHGRPDTTVSDNEPSFKDQVFTQFLARNGIRHVRVAPCISPCMK